MKIKQVGVALGAVMMALAGGCGDAAPPQDEAPAQVQGAGDCGKCDGPFEGFKDAFSDMRDIKLDDLTTVGAALATEEINRELRAVPYSTIRLSPTEVYGQPRELLGEALVHDLDALHAGLTEELGEAAFATKITALRREHLSSRPEGAVFAESHFTLGAGFDPKWRVDAGDLVGTVGFSADRGIEAVVIAPYDDATEAVLNNPLEAIEATRGFILPTTMAQISKMAPGESISLRNRGGLGVNLGVGVPFLIATVGDAVALRTRLSFGARVGMEGLLDVHLVRGAGQTAYVDVGLGEQALRHFEVALATGWGIEGLPEVEVDLGFTKVSLAELAQKALRKQLDAHLQATASASTTNARARLTVARFRVDLNQGGDALAQAVAQALRGDVRLAQALANRPDSGVIQELDLLKTSRTEANHLGFSFLGMKFYRTNVHRTGLVSIEADGRNQTILFGELERRGQVLFTERGATWRKLVSLESKDGQLVDATLNARLTIHESDLFLERDQLLDHIDPMLSHQLDPRRFYREVSAATDAIVDFVDHACPRPSGRATPQQRRRYRECIDEAGRFPQTQELRDKARDAYDEVLAETLVDGFDPALMSNAQVADTLFELKLNHSSEAEYAAAFVGPKATLTTQLRFSHEALEAMFQRDGRFAFRAALEDTLRLMAARRIADLDKKTDLLDEYVADRAERLDELADLFQEATARYQQYGRIARARTDEEAFGQYASVVLVPEAEDQEIKVASVAEHQGDVIEAIFFELVDRAEAGIFGDLDEPGAFVLGYTLLKMTESDQIELMSFVDFKDNDELADMELYTRGRASFIDAGQFNLDELLAD